MARCVGVVGADELLELDPPVDDPVPPELLDEELLLLPLELPPDELPDPLPELLEDEPLDELPPPELCDELLPPKRLPKKCPMAFAVLDTAWETEFAIEVVAETTVSIAR